MLSPRRLLPPHKIKRGTGLASDAAQSRGKMMPGLYKKATKEENHTTEYKCIAFKMFTVAFNGPNTPSFDEALKPFMPPCPQTIQGSLLDTNLN